MSPNFGMPPTAFGRFARDSVAEHQHSAAALARAADAERWPYA